MNLMSLASMLQEARHFQVIYLWEQRFDAYVVMSDDNKGFHDHDNGWLWEHLLPCDDEIIRRARQT